MGDPRTDDDEEEIEEMEEKDPQDASLGSISENILVEPTRVAAKIPVEEADPMLITEVVADAEEP